MTIAAWLSAAVHRPDVRYGVQTFLGLFVFLSILSPPAVWNALTLKDATITPVYSVVSFMVCLQANVGTALLYVALRITGAVLGGALGVAATYITYGANGSSFTSSTTKGAVMVTVICVMVFFLSLYRYKYPRFSVLFIVASFSLPLVALSGYHLDYVQNKIIGYWILEVTLGVVAAGLVAMLIFPSAAGTAVVASTQKSISLLGKSAVELMEILFREQEKKEGQDQDNSVRQQGLDGTSLNGGVDGSGIEKSGNLSEATSSIETFMELYVQPVSAALIQSKSNLEATETEINVYHKPHLFPKAAYKVLLTVLRHFLSTLMTVRYLLEGDAPLRATRPLRRHIDLVVAGINATFGALAQCLNNDAADDAYLAALSELKELEAALHALGAVRVESIEYLESEVLMANTVLALVFSMGSFVRRACFIMPDVLPRHGAGVRSAWRKHFKGSVWDFKATPGHPGMQKPAMEAKSPLAHRLSSLTGSQSLPFTADIEALIEAQQGDHHCDPSVGDTTASFATGAVTASQHTQYQRFPSLVKALEEDDGRSRSIQRTEEWKDGLKRHTGFSWEEVSLAAQIAVSLAIACTLHVCTTTYNALDKRTIWIVITVVVLLQHSIGGVLLRGANRMVATLLTGLLGMGVLYGVYLINGLSYTNKFLKFGAMCVLLPGIEGVVAWSELRSPRLVRYGYMVLKLSIPIVVLPGYSSETLSATAALWRICNVALGLFIELLVGAFVLPVSTRAAVQRRVRDALDALTEVTAATSLHTLGADKDRHSMQNTVNPSSPRDLETGAMVPRSPPSNQRVASGIVELAVPPSSPATQQQQQQLVKLSPSAQNLPPIRTSVPHSSLPENSPSLSPRSLASTEAYFSDTTPRTRPMRRRRKKWLKRATYGAPVLQLHQLGAKVASGVRIVNELTDLVTFEEKVLPRWARSLTTDNMVAARRAIRQYLNALLSFSYVLCGPEVPHLRLLLPFRPHIEAVAVQLLECLRAASAVASGRLPPGSGAPTQRALQAQVQALLAEVESAPLSEECTEADAMLGFASLGVLVAVVQTMDVLRVSLDRLFSTEDTASPSKHVTATPLSQAQVQAVQLSSSNKEKQLLPIASSAHIILSGADEQQRNRSFARSASSMQGLSATQRSRAGVSAAAAAATKLETTGEDEDDLMPRTEYD